MQSIVIDYVKNAHPFYFTYFVQRIEADCDLIISEIPKVKEEHDKSVKEGKMPMFHPNFYVNYVNSQIDLINELRKLYSKSTKEEFVLKPHVEYFND